MSKIVILGSGIAGLSASYHIGHDKCIIFEKNSYSAGHVNTDERGEYFWDEGPHISFTKSKYVKDLFMSSTETNKFDVKAGNYFKGVIINHPAQNHLNQLPKKIRDKIIDDFIKTRKTKIPKVFLNYEEWCNYAFGKLFTKTFTKPYTLKYWNCDPSELGVDWIGNRIYFPKIKDVIDGSKFTPKNSNNYIQQVIYPKKGGFRSFTDLFVKGANLKTNKEVTNIDLENRIISFSDNDEFKYDKLISTIPLDKFVILTNLGEKLYSVSKMLNCTSLLLVNIEGDYKSKRHHNWIYVYDEDKLSTRVSFIETLSKNNTPKDKTGIQIEVYYSKKKPLSLSENEIKEKVCQEMLDMNLIDKIDAVHSKNIEHANIVCDRFRKESMNIIFNELEKYGLKREKNDLLPFDDWNSYENLKKGDLILAGRFGQWKYYWTDDCVLRGKAISESI